MSIEEQKPFRYLALGDSYTIGEAVDPSERFPCQLQRKLSSSLGSRPVEVDVIAKTGWTTGDLQKAVDGASLSQEFDLVSLLIGVNNQYQGRSLEEYRLQFTRLLEQAIALAQSPARVFVVSIPDYGFTPFGLAKKEHITQQLDLFNAANLEITASVGVAYFDITPISRKGLEEPVLVASDQLHPSAEMYRRWVNDVIFPNLIL